MALSFPRRLTGDLPLKLVSFLLALVVWYGAGSRQTVERSFKIPLELRNIPEGLIVLGDPPSNAVVRIKGQGRFLGFRLKHLSCVVDGSEAEQGLFLRPITVTDVVVPPGLDVTVEEIIEPRMLRLEVRNRGKKRVPVEAVLAGSPPPGFTVVGSPRVEPAQVELGGPQNVIDGIHSLLLEDVELERSRGPIVVRRRVKLAGLAKVSSTPEEVEVTVAIEPIAQARFDGVPVRLGSGSSGLRGEATPNAVSVLLSGPKSVVTVLEARSLALTVDADRLDAGDYDYRSDIVGENRVAFLPVASDSARTARGAPGAPHRSATISLPPQVRIVEISPSYFSIRIERPARRRGRS